MSIWSKLVCELVLSELAGLFDVYVRAFNKRKKRMRREEREREKKTTLVKERKHESSSLLHFFRRLA